MRSLLTRPEWLALKTHCEELNFKNKENKKANELKNSFILHTDALDLNCFYPHVTIQTQKLLTQLAIACELSEKVKNLFEGKIVNISENLAALHTQMRDDNPSLECQNNLEKIREVSEKIRNKKWLGYTGKPVEAILHIGIGGSDLCQRLTCHALDKYANPSIAIYFVANIDPEEMEGALKKLNPETTLIIMASKSFSTLETQMNMDRALQWLESPAAIQKQVIAVTAYADRITQRNPNVSAENILSVPLGIGGRYSIWSAMGLVLAVAIGFEQFKEFLHGAHVMDKHFRETPYEQNIPVMLALTGIWNINFFHCQTHAIIPYSERLFYFPNHLQQLDMESNGKSETIDGEKVNYATGPIVWGGIGCNSQHSFHQLLHQGTHLVPVDFVMINHSKEAMEKDPRLAWLNSNCKAQVQAMFNNPHCIVNLITLNTLTPYTLGALIALYEHKIFVQSQIWGVNPFDQPGVEEAKILAKKMMLGS